MISHSFLIAAELFFLWNRKEVSGSLINSIDVVC